MHANTELIHAGEGEAPRAAPLNRPVYASTTWLFESADEVRAYAEGRSAKYLYSRYANPTVEGAEAKIAAAEGAESALLYASGMAATSGLLLGLLQAGDEIAVAANVYGGTFRLVRDFLPRLGVKVRWVAPDELSSAELGPTKLLWFETPSNPSLRCVSLADVARHCRDRGVMSVCDNTFAGPLVQRPLQHGVDVVMHSATKSLNGHSDVTAGALCGSAALMKELDNTRRVLGATLDPQAAFLLARGLKTLAVRTARVNQTTQQLAEWLEASGLCERVWYPGLASHPDYHVARAQMTGFGGMITLDVGTQARAEAAFDKLQLIERATSLGGVESLCSLPVLTSHWGLSDDELSAAGVTPGMIRLSVGLEEPDDLRADLEQALRAL